jgi:putative phosphoesterase
VDDLSPCLETLVIMKIGVISDTHRNRRLMHAVAEKMTADLGATLLFHLGDDYADGEELSHAGYDVRYVPGLWCPEYNRSTISKRVSESCAGVAVVAVHALKDLRAPDLSNDVILSGHTHKALVEQVGPVLYVNPGHLKGLKDRGERASFATLDLEPGIVTATIYEATGEPRFSLTAKITRNA